MPAPKGNTFAAGNAGGGRPSVKESIWHKEKWETDSQVRALEAKIATGVYSVRDVYLLRALKADVAILKNMADKVLATLVDHTTNGKDIGIEGMLNPAVQALAKEYEDKLKVEQLKQVTFTANGEGTNTTSIPS